MSDDHPFLCCTVPLYAISVCHRRAVRVACLVGAQPLDVGWASCHAACCLLGMCCSAGRCELGGMAMYQILIQSRVWFVRRGCRLDLLSGACWSGAGYPAPHRCVWLAVTPYRWMGPSSSMLNCCLPSKQHCKVLCRTWGLDQLHPLLASCQVT